MSSTIYKNPTALKTSTKEHDSLLSFSSNVFCFHILKCFVFKDVQNKSFKNTIKFLHVNH